VGDQSIPAKHEANVLVRMEADGLTIPPYDWAIEPQGLGPNVYGVNGRSGV